MMGCVRRLRYVVKCVKGVQLKVTDFGTNRQRACDFVLVINNNCGSIFSQVHYVQKMSFVQSLWRLAKQ